MPSITSCQHQQRVIGKEGMSKKVTVQLKQKRTPVLTDRVRVFLPTSQKQQRISLQSVISPLAMAIFSPPHKRQTWTTTGVQLSFGRKHETESPDPPCFTNKRVFSFVFLPTLFLSVLCGPVSCFVLPLPSPPHPTPAPLLPAFHADAMSPPFLSCCSVWWSAVPSLLCRVTKAAKKSSFAAACYIPSRARPGALCPSRGATVVFSFAWTFHCRVSVWLAFFSDFSSLKKLPIYHSNKKASRRNMQTTAAPMTAVRIPLKWTEAAEAVLEDEAQTNKCFSGLTNQQLFEAICQRNLVQLVYVKIDRSFPLALLLLRLGPTA